MVIDMLLGHGQNGQMCKHEHGHVAWIWTCRMDMDMLHGQRHAA
jgi:hypothetical protein